MELIASVVLVFSTKLIAMTVATALIELVGLATAIATAIKASYMCCYEYSAAL